MKKINEELIKNEIYFMMKFYKTVEKFLNNDEICKKAEDMKHFKSSWVHAKLNGKLRP